MAKVEGRLTKVEGRLTRGLGKNKVTIEISGKLKPASRWDEFFAQLQSLSERHNIRVRVLKKKTKLAGKAKKKAPSKK